MSKSLSSTHFMNSARLWSSSIVLRLFLCTSAWGDLYCECLECQRRSPCFVICGPFLLPRLEDVPERSGLSSGAVDGLTAHAATAGVLERDLVSLAFFLEGDLLELRLLTEPERATLPFWLPQSPAWLPRGLPSASSLRSASRPSPSSSAAISSASSSSGVYRPRSRGCTFISRMRSATELRIRLEVLLTKMSPIAGRLNGSGRNVMFQSGLNSSPSCSSCRRMSSCRRYSRVRFCASWLMLCRTLLL
mmetsp:Transcript_47208/g.120430  ORF Transcript_47208/g.120430 Transcript_47208/m.120430 type:complete len:248 (-) Transcript_47208:1726-2469(-)